MNAIEFLTLPDLLQIHFDQIEKFGGSAETTDYALLNSVILLPKASVEGRFTCKFPYEMASEYLYQIAANRPFVDGNCRTAAVAALLFLEWNEIQIEADPGKLAALTLAVASGKAGKAEIVEFLEKHAVHAVNN
jgi:death on curing protein